MNWRVESHIESFIDVTLSTQKMDEENLTDHRYIGYEIKVDQAPERVVEKRKFITDWNAFRAHLQLRLCNMSDEDKRSHKLCIEIIREAYLNSRSEGPRGERAVPYWWDSAISEKRKECNRIRRQYTRTGKNASEEERQNVLENHKRCKKNLRKLIRDSKQRHWKELCKSLNNDVWGDGFKMR
ncbi:hypothetical protein QE152_g37155 [Popillia japonica]|uniref:Uncharacterized protein n=1 Tax=Popillia japonica TaxID=7064 RepID=A0AAW1IAS6_POPJA